MTLFVTSEVTKLPKSIKRGVIEEFTWGATHSSLPLLSSPFSFQTARGGRFGPPSAGRDRWQAPAGRGVKGSWCGGGFLSWIGSRNYVRGDWCHSRFVSKPFVRMADVQSCWRSKAFHSRTKVNVYGPKKVSQYHICLPRFHQSVLTIKSIWWLLGVRSGWAQNCYSRFECQIVEWLCVGFYSVERCEVSPACVRFRTMCVNPRRHRPFCILRRHKGGGGVDATPPRVWPLIELEPRDKNERVGRHKFSRLTSIFSTLRS